MSKGIEDFIRTNKLFGAVFNKKNKTTSGQIPVFANGDKTKLEDSGITSSVLKALVNSGIAKLQCHTTIEVDNLDAEIGTLVFDTDLQTLVIFTNNGWKMVVLTP